VQPWQHAGRQPQRLAVAAGLAIGQRGRLAIVHELGVAERRGLGLADAVAIAILIRISPAVTPGPPGPAST
jgi:hypothetical protein